jgi:predicted transglutaminase-like cysteine proteinase
MFEMKKLMCMTLFLMLTAGCAALYQPAPDRINGAYYEQIKEWQRRVNEEGWTKNLVDDMVNESIKLSKYRLDKKGDHWDTPKEFIARSFQGDCEDIGIFAMANLKRLKYPHKVRIMAVKTLLITDHAVLRVEMPDGKWKMYNTVPMPLDEIDQSFWRPIVEFDEKDIIYFERKRAG